MTANPLEFTGERFVPGIAGEIAHEHWHRYAFARRFVAGRRVAGRRVRRRLRQRAAGGDRGKRRSASTSTRDAIAHARGPLCDAREPAVRAKVPRRRSRWPTPASTPSSRSRRSSTSPREDQPRMIAEFARVLAPDGCSSCPSPNPVEYSRGARLPQSVPPARARPRGELDAPARGAFPARRWYRQRRYFGSALWSEDGTGSTRGMGGRCGPACERRAGPAGDVLRDRRGARARRAAVRGAALSLFTERDEAELARIDAQARRGAAPRRLAQASATARSIGRPAHVRHSRGARRRARPASSLNAMRELADARTRSSARGDAVPRRARSGRCRGSRRRGSASTRSMPSANGSSARSRAQERIIAYRQSARWWLTLPWLRVKLLWKRDQGAT